MAAYLLKEFPTFCEIQLYITVLTTPHKKSISLVYKVHTQKFTLRWADPETLCSTFDFKNYVIKIM
jgi:hypothetical protein